MATIKSFTDLPQSNVLAEILPLESADMCYLKREFNDTYIETPILKPEGGVEKSLNCWSLAALLSVLPQSITKYIESERCQKTFHLNLFHSYYYCVSYSFSPSISDDDGNNTLYCVGRDNWVDACYEMVICLHELNLL